MAQVGLTGVAQVGLTKLGTCSLIYPLKFASVFLWLLPWFVAIFTKKKQAVHDLLVSTVVIELSK